MCTPQCIFEKLGGLAFDEAIKAGKYIVRYAKILKNMQDEMRDLDDRKEDIESKVCEARDRSEEIKVDVLHWQSDVDTLKKDVDRLVGQSTARENMRCITCSCPNIMRRYKLSKQAEEHIVDANNLIKKSHFEEISRPRPRPPELESLSDNNYVNFDSRASIYKDLMDALKDSNVNMIGVYGLGGVGKTTLVKAVGDQMRQETFKQVAFAVVSKDLNVKEVQSELAGSLNLKLTATTDDQEGRRTDLWNKFTNGDKYLVILDDIWEMVDLKKIGIPISDGKTGCKVVLTSRKEDLLRITMKADRNFSIAELPEAEAWDLFKKKVENYIESRPQIHPLACELCRHCKGLPLAINALGTALQDKPDYTWKNALDKLKKYMLTQIEGIDRGVMATLRVSYDMLWSSDAQSCFLLCCLFAEDAEIPIEELTRHCMARRLLAQNPQTFDEARNAVLTVVDALKSASLLTTGGHENVVKIHDVIRDVGISISRDEKAFLIDHVALQWPENPINGPSYSTISLNFKNIKELPNGLVYPQLYTLMVGSSELSDLEVPDNFFNGMTQLTVLSFTKMRMRRLPSSLAKLKNLRMLNLNGCELEDIAILKDLKSKLEVLSLRGSKIKALPPEIAQLTSLRLLDLRDCFSLREIPQGIISNLTNLEELLFPNNFYQWEAIIDKKKEGTNSNSKNMGLEELRQSLDNGQLTTLHIFIPNVKLLPKDGLKFENLKRFRISVGSNFDWYEHFKWYENFPGTRVLKNEGSSLRNEFIPLVYKAEALSLIGIKGLKEVLDYRGVGNGFPDLRYLVVKSCDDDLEYFLGEPKSSVQSHMLHPLQSFNKLNRLVIEMCKLRYLFTPTVARGLVHLEELTVSSCEIMEAIVGFEGQNDENELIGDVMFSKLKELVLEELPNLISFYAEKEKTQTTTGSSFAHPQPLFSNKVILPVLERLEVEKLDSIEEIWDKQSPSVNQETVSFGQLRVMIVGRCKKLMNLVPSNMLPRLQNLRDLRVEQCPNVEFVVFKNWKEEEVAYDSTLIIPLLKHLRIWKMEKLKSFYSSSTTSSAQSLFNHQVILPVLEELQVEELGSIEEIWDKQSPSVNEKTASFSQLTDVTVKKCEKLMNLGPWNILSRLRNLQRLTVDGCPNVEFIVLFKNGKGEEEVADDSTLIIPLLRHLRIEKMEKLKSFYSSSTTANAQSFFNHQVILPSLEVLEVQALDSIKEIWDKQSTSVIKKTASFSQLRDMTVKECKELVNLVPANILPRLRNLQSLTVDGCPNVEVIVLFKNGKEEEVADESTFIIPQLRYLAIRNMEKLKSFCSSSTTSNAQSLFNHQVILPVLEELEVEELDSIEEIWDKQSPSVNQETASFGQLKKMTVRWCMKMMNLGPWNILSRLRNLQRLTVDGCPNVEFIVLFKNGKGEEEAADERTLIIPQLRYLAIQNMEKLKSFCSSSTTSNAQSLFNHQVILPSLEVLEVQALDSIKEIWDKQSTSVIKKTASFSQLRDMTVKKCKELVNLGPANILPRLRNLQRLTVDSCPNVEVIVLFKNGKEEEAADESTFIIPQLRYLAIQNMAKLKSFCSSSTTSNAQSLFNHQVIFPVLETLHIEEVGNVIEIWDKQSIGLFEAQESFCQLMNLQVRHCNKLIHLFPSKMHLLLKNLKTLHVTRSETMEGVVGFEEELDDRLGKDQLCFSKLTSLYLIGLPKLVSFYIKMGEAGTIEGNPTIHAQPLFNGKVILPVLEELKVESLDSIEEIWDKQSPSVNQETESFSQLRNIEVKGCKKLMNLVPSNILPRLRNLQFLKVDDCPNVEFVVFKNKKGEEEAADDSTLIIPQLRNLRIWTMEKLKSFYSSSSTSNAQSLFNHQIAFPALENLYIWDTPSITEIWDKKPLSEPEQEIESFGKLATIDISDCPQLVYLLPSYMIPHLQNLQILEIEDCEEVEVIVSMEFKEKEATDPVLFSRLKNVKFSNLPKLKGFIFSNKVAFPALEHLTIMKVPKIKEIWDKQPLPEPEKKPKSFYKLMSIHVAECDQLVYVFPSYMLPQLQYLQKLVITNCKEMEVIISNKLKEKEATNNDIIPLAKLKTVILQNLPNLKRLCAEMQLGFSNKNAFPMLEINTIEVAIKDIRLWFMMPNTSSIDPDLTFLVNGTSRKEVATEESGTSGKDEDSNDHDKEGEDGEEDIKNADDNKGVGGEEKDEDDQRKEDEEENEDHISKLD